MQLQQKGFSLIEVLVTIVVLSVGLLGIAGLQVTGMRFAHNANLRYIAVMQAADMADRIRANRAGLAAGSYNNIAAGTGSDPGCISSGCSPAQMAATDRFQWNTANADRLPAGSGTVAGAGSGSIFTITLTWNAIGPAGTGVVAETYVLSVQI